MVGNSSKSCTNRDMPSFFKIIISGYPTDNILRIPPKFLEHIHNDMSERATLKLKASSDCSWNVRVKRTTSGVYLQNGWQEFLKDNGLGNSEFLVFKYGGRMRFSIQIFDKSGFERTDDFSNGSTHENLYSANRKSPRKIKKENAGSSSELYEIKEEQEEDNQDNAARDLATFKSKFPHFIKNRCKIGVMALPKSFSGKYFSPGKSEMYVLESSKGRRTWEVKVYSAPSDNQYFFTAGWNNFVKDNQIEVGDTCVFELVGRNKMVVHIFRSLRKM